MTTCGAVVVPDHLQHGGVRKGIAKGVQVTASPYEPHRNAGTSMSSRVQPLTKSGTPLQFHAWDKWRSFDFAVSPRI
jgi:hypothetical protein